MQKKVDFTPPHLLIFIKGVYFIKKNGGFAFLLYPIGYNLSASSAQSADEELNGGIFDTPSQTHSKPLSGNHKGLPLQESLSPSLYPRQERCIHRVRMAFSVQSFAHVAVFC